MLFIILIMNSTELTFRGWAFFCGLFFHPDEDQETSGDFGSGGAVILLGDQEEEPTQSWRSRQKKRRGRIHPRGAIEDDEDEEDDKDDDIGYAW